MDQKPGQQSCKKQMCAEYLNRRL